MTKDSKTYVFIDAANLFYGGEKSLGWKIDYHKLLNYLKTKFNADKVFYYAGIDIHNYTLDEKKGIILDDLISYYENLLSEETIKDTDKTQMTKYLQRSKFYKKLEEFGYTLRIKPVKIYENEDVIIRKANCDVDLTFDLMRYMSQYSSLVILSGDGDFAPILEYLKGKKKHLTILARGNRTAKEIRQLAGDKFMDFKYLSRKISIGKKQKEAPL